LDLVKTIELMNYKDKTFCTFWKDCKSGKSCPRALTDEIKQGAKRWMSSVKEPPICVYADKPDCFVDKHN